MMQNIDIYQAKSDNYFKNSRCPIAVKKVFASNSVQHEHDLTTKNHTHDFAELVILTQGKGRQIIDEEIYDVEQGDVFLIQGESSHNFLDRNQVSMVNVQFDSTKLPLPIDWLKRIEGYNIIFEIEPNSRSVHTFKHRLKLHSIKLNQLLNIVEQLDNIVKVIEVAENSSSEAEAFTKLLELIVFISREYSSTQSLHNNSIMRLGKIISLLESEYTKSWTLEKMAKLASTSPNNFLRLFKKATNMTPLEYLTNVRLARGAELLIHSDKSISEIAILAGFNDSNYFSRKFNDKYNISPSKYRS